MSLSSSTSLSAHSNATFNNASSSIATYLIEQPSAYVKLNVGGNLFYTTVGTLISRSNWFYAMFSGHQQVKADDDGWILIDRSGKHFGIILNFLRDGDVPLPENRMDLQELLKEAKYFCIDGLSRQVEEELESLKKQEEEDNQFSPNRLSSIVIVKCPVLESSLLRSVKRPIVKLKMNRSNNVFSYTTNSHDVLLRHIECLEKYALMFMDTVLFIRDVRNEKNEVCEWSFYYRGLLLKKIDCSSIHYSTDARLTKVEFPESKIHEEMLGLISLATRKISDKELFEIHQRKQNSNIVGNGSAVLNSSSAGLLLTSNNPVYSTDHLPLDSIPDDNSSGLPESEQAAAGAPFHIPGTASNPNLIGAASTSQGNSASNNGNTASGSSTTASSSSHKRLFSSLRFR